MILFLNKSDLFVEKIEKKSLKLWDEEYDGPDGDFEAGVVYIRERFKAQAEELEEEERSIYVGSILCFLSSLPFSSIGARDVRNGP